MDYYIDLKRKSISSFKIKLRNSRLLPSQKVLEDHLDEGFETLENLGLKNLYDIWQALKTKDKLQKFSEESGLPTDYLTVLRREVNSYHPQPRKINDFSCIKPEIKTEIGKMKIKSTVQLYDRVATREARAKLVEDLAIGPEDVLLLARLTDFCRMRYVNADFATLMVHSDYDTIDKIKGADYKELHSHLTQVNSEKNYFRGKIALNDMKLFIRDANYISSAVEF
ncbi:MAG: DUF4332 domain-containing protein [Cytophagales bacterium]|nr:DUF4332 domain-containing protein [Cytophagales bacterium]